MNYGQLVNFINDANNTLNSTSTPINQTAAPRNRTDSPDFGYKIGFVSMLTIVPVGIVILFVLLCRAKSQGVNNAQERISIINGDHDPENGNGETGQDYGSTEDNNAGGQNNDYESSSFGRN